MRQRTLCGTLCLCSVLVTTVAGPAWANLVANGSFETGSYSANGAGFMRLASGSTTISGWTVGGQSGLDWLSSPLHGTLSGSKSVNLKGTTGGTFGEISTTISTVSGGMYTITFGAYGGQQTNTGSVSAGDLVDQLFTAAGTPSVASPQFATYQFQFRALGSSTTLSFRSSTSNGFGPVIDDVVVEALAPAVPAPGAAALALIGLPIVGWVKRRFA